MPAKAAPYVPLPFVGEPYRDSGQSRTLAQLMLQRGDSQAAMHLQRGDAQARAFAQAGNVINNAVNGWQQNVEQNRQREIDAAREARAAEMSGMQMEATRLQLDEAKRQTKGRAAARAVLPLAQREDGVYGYDRDVIAREMEAAGAGDMLPDIFKNLDEQEQSHRAVMSARRDAISDDALRLLRSGSADEDAFENLLEVWGKNDLAPTRDLDLMRKAAKAHGIEQALIGAVGSSERGAQALLAMQKANEPKLQTVAPGASVIDERNPKAGALFTAPAAEKTPGSIEAAILEAERRGDRATVERLIGMKKEIAAAGRAPGAPAPQEPLTAIVGPDGQPVLVPRSQAVGKKPASTRETGRQVTSGDAGDIAEFNTALDDVDTLRATLSGNTATGARAQMGAALPNAVTEMTGWGSDAKQKQAVIDRVKQVIGKALEGGVLRKEDELKYAKILPTIGDPADVVDAKLAGLRAALARRQERKLEALESAGYDVTKFGAGAKPAAGGGEWQDVGGFRVRVKP